MKSSPRKTRHLVFLAHAWLCAPFLYVWLTEPWVRSSVPPGIFEKMQFTSIATFVYLVVRTALAFRDPKWFWWEYICPPIDIAIISYLIFLGDRDPMSHLSMLYLFPVAEAAATLNVSWAASAAAMSLVGASLATEGFQTRDPYGATFRYFFIFILASLLTTLARVAASLREQLGVARDRERIAAEMHDGVQGHLISVGAQLELASQVASRDPGRSAEIVRESRETAVLAADELRYLVQRMRSPSLADGFVEALKQFGHNQTSRANVEFEFELHGPVRQLDSEIEHGLFRIAQEAVTNVIRHAEASKVVIGLDYHRGYVQMCVRDDGIGVASGGAPDGRGISGMQQRATALGGSLSLEPNQPSGCVVKVVMPLERHAIARAAPLS